MKARQILILEPHKIEVREVELPAPAANQVLVETEFSAVSPGTELAVWKGTHQWLKDPKLPHWKFPFRPGYSAAGRIVAVGSAIGGWKPGDRVSYPGNHASAELLMMGSERGRLWKLPEKAETEKAAWACVARYGLGAAIRPGVVLGRAAAILGLGVIGQFSLRCLQAAGAYPIIGIDGVKMRRDAAQAAGADYVIDPAAADAKSRITDYLKADGAEIVVDATGIPDAVPFAVSLACSAGQVVIVGSPRGKAAGVNFYDDLHRRYIEVTGAHGNMLFEPAHTRLAGAWDIDKAQQWLLAALTSGRLNLTSLVTHPIAPPELGTCYEGLQNKKEEYLGVVIDWRK